MSVFTVRMKQPPRELSPNYHAPLDRKAAVAARYKVISAKQKTKTEAMLLTRSALGGRKFKPESYKLVWYYKGVQPDADNCIARCKALLDGCAAALGIDDRELECDGIGRVHTLERGVTGTVDVVFTGTWEGGGA